jgi:hypothetical protein
MLAYPRLLDALLITLLHGSRSRPQQPKAEVIGVVSRRNVAANRRPAELGVPDPAAAPIDPIHLLLRVPVLDPLPTFPCMS